MGPALKVGPSGVILCTTFDNTELKIMILIINHDFINEAVEDQTPKGSPLQ